MPHEPVAGASATCDDTATVAILAIIVTVFMWGLSSVGIKLTSATGIVTALYRCWLAIPLLWLTAALPRVRRELDREWLLASLVGGGLFGVHQLIYFTSLKLTTVTNVAIIGALQPLVVLPIAGPMFGERATLRAVLWSVAALAGTGLVIVGSTGLSAWSPLGDALAALNVLAFTAYFLASKRIRARVQPWPYVVGMTTVSGCVMLTAALATGQDLLSPHGTDWLVFLMLAVFPGTLGHALMNWAHAHVSAFVISTLFLGVPVVAAAAAATLLGERITPLQIAGGAIVLMAIARMTLTGSADVATLAEGAAETDAP